MVVMASNIVSGTASFLRDFDSGRAAIAIIRICFLLSWAFMALMAREKSGAYIKPIKKRLQGFLNRGNTGHDRMFRRCRHFVSEKKTCRLESTLIAATSCTLPC